MPGFIVPHEELVWHVTVARAIHQRLCWSSAGMLLTLLEGDAPFEVSDDGYNLCAIAMTAFHPFQVDGEEGDCDKTQDSITWAIRGGCGYGSRVTADPMHIEIRSCEGHWVRATRMPDGAVKWEVDSLASENSWGPSIVQERIASLRFAHANPITEVTVV